MGVTLRGTVLLVAVLAALVSYLWLGERHPRAEATLPALLSARPADVARIELQEGENRLTAVRNGAGWTDESGRPLRGDTIGDLIEALATLRPVMLVDPAPENPADYGLGAGATHLELKARDGKPLALLEVGERNPAWTGLYARVGGKPEVVLVGAVLHWELEKLHDAAPAG